MIGMNRFHKTYKKQQEIGEVIKASKTNKDKRYNNPKEDPKVSEELIEDTIKSTEIYNKAKELILKSQRKQVGYGLEKYPEPLNADTWSTIETIDHIIEESVDRLHYLVMLRIKLEREASVDVVDYCRNDEMDSLSYAMSFINYKNK